MMTEILGRRIGLFAWYWIFVTAVIAFVWACVTGLLNGTVWTDLGLHPGYEHHYATPSDHVWLIVIAAAVIAAIAVHGSQIEKRGMSPRRQRLHERAERRRAEIEARKAES